MAQILVAIASLLKPQIAIYCIYQQISIITQNYVTTLHPTV
ncbi:hypothetical protein FDUTEX481_07993 [Tolypothrix sp. PCC 7601]|nr:hypothetical protein FDUTEX481_07993 [Tolypothrix sp. PCC 7601]